MKIAIIAHSFFPIKEPFAGGLEMITYLLVKELLGQNHKVDLYAHPESCETLPLVPMLTESDVLTKFDGKDISDSGMGEGAFVQTVVYHNVMAEILARGYDIVHNHSLHHVPILLGNTLGARFITSIHSLADIYLKLGFGALPLVRQTVTSVSNHQRRHVKDTVTVNRTVHNGIDLDQWIPNYQVKENYFFWMGRMCAEKAPHHAIAACLGSSRRLLLAGPVSDPNYFAEFVEPHLHHESIVYLGHLTHDEIAPRLREATAYLFTSVWEEPYGLTMAESLACGTPVIAYRVGAAPEIVTPEAGLMVEKGDTDGLMQALRMVSQIDRRACRQRAEAFCSSAIMTKKYLALYQEVKGPQPTLHQPQRKRPDQIEVPRT